MQTQQVGVTPQPLLTQLPDNQLAALAAIAAATGSQFNEVLEVAVGFALRHARDVFGQEFAGEYAEVQRLRNGGAL